MKAKGLRLKPGAFGENVVISGLNTRFLGIGSRLRLDEAEVEVTQIGKVCHSRCAIYYKTGDCIMPRQGLFASVTREGSVNTGSEAEVVYSLPRAFVQAAVLIPQGRENEGDAAAAILEAELGAHIAWRGQAPEAADEATALLRQLCGRGLDLVVALVADTPEGSILDDAVRATMERPSEANAAGLPIYGVGAGAVLVAAEAGDAANVLRSLASSLGGAAAELRRARAADNGDRQTGTTVPIVPRVSWNDDTTTGA